MSRSKPNFQSVVDLGLRDVGEKNQPRAIAKQFGKASLAAIPLAIIFALAICALLRRSGADDWLLVVFLLAWTSVVIALAVHTARRMPRVVVRVNAQGKNQATWVMLGPFVLLAAQAALIREALLIPPLAFGALFALLIWRSRGQVPELLRRLRGVLEADEKVLGDGLGIARGVRNRREAVRVIAATDRRLLVASGSRAADGWLVVDVPYENVSAFGVDWKVAGRVGVLSLAIAGRDRTPAERHILNSVAPLNLVSIVRALQAHGVRPEDPGAVEELERAWEEAREPGAPPPPPLLDPATMSTREFDRALWLLLVASAVVFYVNPLDTDVAVLVGCAVACLVCGYASGTTASLTYIAPLNLLLVPSFFFTATSDVLGVMLALSAVAAACLLLGSALRRRKRDPEEPTPAHSGLRQALSGARLVRISAAMLACVFAMVTVASAAGFELTTLRFGVDEVLAKQLPADGRSNLTGRAASLTYTPGPDLHEFVTDEDWGAGPNDGARWELRSSFTAGENFISLAHYIFEPRLDDPAALAEFLADKDEEHARIAGFDVGHTERVIDGRRGYVWTHGNRHGYWHYAVWFPQRVHTIRLECIAKDEARRFKRLCGEAAGSLRFH